jgi:protein-disulfide isomerase
MRLIRLAARLTARLTTLGAAALLSLGAGNPPAGPHPNWLNTVSVSPNGGHLLGNPGAPVKLVEYISYTCPHCAHFQRQSEVAMRLAYIQSGKVQVEVRHLIRDPIDMTVAMLTNCGAPSRFFANHNLFLLNQDRWIGRMADATAAQRARWITGDNGARMRAIASDYGFYAMMEQRGYDRPTLDRCLADMPTANRIAAQTVEAGKLGVQGTPGFLLNGVLLAGTYDWQALNLQLEARF